MYLAAKIKKLFSDVQDPFAAVMALKGKSYRALEGRHTQQVCLGGQTYFIKQHFGIGWREILKNLCQLRLPILSAKNEWQALARLKNSDIGLPAVIGYGSRGFNPATRQSFVLLEDISDTIQLDHYCAEWQVDPPLFQEKLNLITEVARMVRIMHQQGVNHRDCYLCHFLLAKESGKLYLLDFHRAQVRSKVPERWRVKDLAGLYFSSKDFGLTVRDQLRFIKAYRCQPLRDLFETERKFWDKVKIRGEKLYRQHQ